MRLDSETKWDELAIVREFTPLPASEYICLVREVDEPQPEPGKTPVCHIICEVQEGEHTGREIHDFIYPQKKNGQPNKIGLGQIKEWGLATVGAERLSAPDFDTKEFEAHSVRIVTGIDAYEVDDPTPGAAPGAKKMKAKTIIKKVVRA